MATEATREGVSPEQGEQQGYQVKERDNALEMIAARREQELVASENDEGAGDDNGVQDEEQQQQDQEHGEEQEQEVEVKVDGQTVKVPVSKVIDAGIRTYQKEAAADKRLEEAARLKAEAERYAQWLATQGRGAEPQQQAQQQVPAWQERLDALGDAIQFGDKEQRNRAMLEYGQIMAGLGAQMALPHMQQAFAERELQQFNQQVAQWFASPPDKGGYGDIASDPELYGIAVALVDSKRANGDTRNSIDFYKEIGDTVRGLRGKFTGGTTASLDERRDKKRKMDSVPTLSGRATSQPQKEETREDVLESMRRSRAS